MLAKRPGVQSETLRARMRQTLAWTVVLVGAGLIVPGDARSENFPTRPVTFIVPYAVGGTVDVQLRVLATATEKHLGQAIVIENRPSATGSLGPAHMAATAKPDGYAVTQHRFAKPGHYLVRVERTNEHGQRAIGYLHVPVEPEGSGAGK